MRKPPAEAQKQAEAMMSEDPTVRSLKVDVLDGVFILFKGFILGHCLAPHVTVVPMMPSKRKAGCR